MEQHLIEKLDQLKSSIEEIFLPKGFSVKIGHLGDWWKPHNCELQLFGMTKHGKNGHVLIRFDITTMIVAYVQGNSIVYEWIIDKFFVRPDWNYRDFYETIYK